MTYWEVRASVTGRWDENARPLVTLCPQSELETFRQRGGTEEEFWRCQTERAEKKARAAGLPPSAAREFVRRARSNPRRLTALLVIFDRP